jgi:CitMHS family citrate-Mg2+:H+ or citrate-Ca2+:H+ symporter
MLAISGFITILGVLVAIMSKRLSPLVALILIPASAVLLIGQSEALPNYMMSGIIAIAPVAVMFMFAILFFGIMNDMGVFTPFINTTLRVCGHDPRKLFIGVVLLTTLVHLDGSGASTFLVVIPAMLPLFDKLHIDRRILACLVAMSAGVNNMLPWGGPTIRAASALDIPVMTLYQPLLFVHLGGLLFVIMTAYWLGHRERRRLITCSSNLPMQADSGLKSNLSHIHWLINLLLIILVIGAIIASILPPSIAFIAGAILALLFNYRELEAQKKSIDAHAKPAFMMVSILIAAGCFTGILRESGMLEAMAMSGSDMLPQSLASSLPLIVALLAMPLSLLFDPDSFYFGILPVLSGIGVEAGLTDTSVAHAALMGQMTTGFPVSPLTPATFLLVGLTRINLADHQRFTIPYLYLTSLFMTILAVVLGVIPL